MSHSRGPSQLVEPIPRHKVEQETPRLCLDLHSFERNLAYHSLTVLSSGKNWRPQTSFHRSPTIALQMIDRGAIGIACATVSEAEIFAEAGIRDILITGFPVGSQRPKRLAALCRTANLVVTCDHYIQAETLSAECCRQHVTCRVLVQINIGMDRAGVRPGRDALELACGIERLPGLKLAGIMGDDGHVAAIDDADLMQKSIDAAMGILVQSRKWFLKNGHCCDIVSATCAVPLPQELSCDVLTEIQGGRLIFGEPNDVRNRDVEGITPVLTVLSTVVSRPAYERAVVDAGRNAIAAGRRPLSVKHWNDAKVAMHCAENMVLQLGPGSRELKIGDQVEFVVNDALLTTMLHEEYVCVRDDRVEDIWPISARGKLT